MKTFTQQRLSVQRCSLPSPHRPTRGRAVVRAFQDQVATKVNQLQQLKEMSVVVADTGEFNSIKEYRPQDVTTNPSLLLKAISIPEYEHLLDQAVAEAKGESPSGRPYAHIADHLAVIVGNELLKIVPGRVSTEVDAHLSYDTQASVDKALRFVDLYSKKGIDPSRLYIKLASTWEGIRAGEILEKQGINVNMTLMFSLVQAAACADAGASLISPFVGRILDWYKKHEGREYTAEEDPGVQSVHRIYRYYKNYGYNTIVMAASFRSADEIREIAGCDYVTIAPKLLAELEASTEPLIRKLFPDMGACDDPKLDMGAGSESAFRKGLAEVQMATDKLKEGVDGFAADQDKLEQIISKKIG